VGAWIKTNGAAIYGTSASPFPHSLSWGGVTSKGNLLYLCVNQLPADRKLTLLELTTKIARAYFLADAKKQPLTITRVDSHTNHCRAGVFPRGFRWQPGGDCRRIAGRANRYHPGLCVFGHA
jgi:hypothetical protein